MTYMIHTFPDRRWYVDGYLVPSMIKQGIHIANIKIWDDVERKGNLFSCMDSFAECGRHPGSTWHLQDDVLICKDFYKRTKDANEDSVICGFCGVEIGPDPKKVGKVQNFEMWWSFQCIHIPNKYAGECSKWFYEEAMYMNRHNIQERIEGGKSDDWFWKRFIREHHPYTEIINLAPNLVEHVDYLLGGSAINKKRTRLHTSAWFEDKDLVDELKVALERGKENACRE